ncbi:hypothetical protein EDD37DRAFT_113505 [Exophiala viscosa]|uniref:uncharacterized protein n=1 Tax=Exophiala viscosa TaxID=2486360 RepID=UPI00218F1619|nr:hypothetical protein EDD37DRAFT_113505 [Exophiala viscosa]
MKVVMSLIHGCPRRKLVQLCLLLCIVKCKVVKEEKGLDFCLLVLPHLSSRPVRCSHWSDASLDAQIKQFPQQKSYSSLLETHTLKKRSRHGVVFSLQAAGDWFPFGTT